MTADAQPVVVCHQALESKTLQEFVSHGKDLAGDSFGFPTTGGRGYTYYSSQWAWNMADKAIRLYRDQGVPLRDGKSAPLVIGLRIPATVESVIAVLAIIRMGHTIQLIAPTLGASHVQGLVKAAKCEWVVNGLDNLDPRTLPLTKVERLHEVETQAGDHDVCWLPAANKANPNEVALMMHSSGSTGPPKLVTKTHGSMLSTLRGIPPVFHDKSFYMGSWFHWMAGFCGVLFSFIRSDVRTCWSEEDDNDADSGEILSETKPQVAWVQPGFLYQAAQTPEGIEALKRCIMVVNVGGVLSTRIATRLLAAGVRLATEYGMTEMPFGLSSAASAGDPNYWDYVQPDPDSAPHLQFRALGQEEGSAWAGGEQLFELVVLPTLPAMDERWANMPDGSLHTGDLFVKHPTQERYKCLGRKADEVEINPTSDGVVMLWARAYESVVENRHADIIGAAALVGSRREKPGLLVFVKPGESSALSNSDILARIWKTVEEELNPTVPLPLAEDMIILVRDAVVPRTPKGEMLRPEVYFKFRDAIDGAFDK